MILVLADCQSKTANRMNRPTPGRQPPARFQRRSRRGKRQPLLTRDPGLAALKQAFVMLRPDLQWNNPVMFVVEVGAFLTLLYIVEGIFGKAASQVPLGYFIALDVWLFLTVLFIFFPDFSSTFFRATII